MKTPSRSDLERYVARALGRRDLGRVVAASIVVLGVVFSAALAYAARPGGGSSYSGGSSRSSGGSSSSSGGGGGGDADLIIALVYLCVEHPTIGIPLVIVLGIVALVRKRASASTSGKEWTTSAGSTWTPDSAPPARREPLRGKLEGLRRTDPGFSIVVFEDFLYFLYAEMHRARGAGGAENLAAYVSDGARALLRNDGRIGEVTGIIIGAMTYESVRVDPMGGARIDVIVESNYVERYRPHGEQRWFARERIRLAREPGAKSRDPGKARTLACPNCGAPLENMRGTTCTYCRTTIPQGTKDWAIVALEVLEREQRGPLLTSSVEEQGTELPTIFDPNLHASFARIVAKDPHGTSWATVQHRVGLIFQEFHAGWVGRDASRVRPFVSDNLFQSQVYWIDLYRAARCINRTDGSRITRIELANATTDAYYDAVTVRLYATGLDYTMSEDGKVLSGSKRKERSYTEYWTLIRGAQKKQTDKNERSCPNCGAPLKISMAGNCEYCRVKVTGGEYDWVLSRIEQDEAYTG